MISQELRTEIRRLFYAEHWKVGTIVAQLGVHRDTVLKALNADGFSNRGVVRSSALDIHVPFMETTLRAYPTLTATRLWEMLRARGYRGSARQVRRRIRVLGLRPRRTEAYLHLRAVPGEQGQVDWAHLGRLHVDGISRPLYAFVVALSWSRAFHVDFSFDQTMGAVMRGHVRAFEHFRGVVRRLLYDNMKTVVLERVGEAIRFHPRLLELAGHYHFAPDVCAPARANEKGGVERRIRDLRSSFLAGRHFTDRDQLRRDFERWRQSIAYQRPCPADRSLTVAQALDNERAVLLPLPAHPLSTHDVRATIARKQPYITWDTNRYSIPHELVGVPLTVVADDERIRVLHGEELVAQHRRCWARHRVLEDAAHLEGLVAAKRRGRAAYSRSRLLEAVPQVAALYVMLAQRGELIRPQTHALLELLARHGAKALGEAIDVALERGTPRAASVEYVLQHRRRTLGEPPVLPLRLPTRPGVHDLTTHTHRLEDYDDLIDHDEDT